MPSVINSITKASPADDYPVVNDTDLSGSYRVVVDLIERDAIVNTQRKSGMLVYVQSDLHFYKLDTGLTNIDWIDLGTDLGGGAGGATYTSLTPATVGVGGLELGESFVGVSFQDLMEQMLHPYQYPAFTAFSIAGQTSPIEVGTTIASGLKTFNWTTSNPSNIQATSVEITDVTGGGTVLGTALADDSTEDINLASPIQKTVQASHVWRIEATNTKTQLFNRNYTVNWYWRMHWGFDANPTIDSANTLLLGSSKLATTKSGSITMPSNPGTSYLYIVYPDSWGAITAIQDVTNSFNATADFTDLGTISHTNALGVVSNYRVYRSNNATGGASGFVYNIT